MFETLVSISALIYVLCLAFIIFHSLSVVPFVPSSKKRFKEIEELVNFYPTDIFFDLGSGDGRLVRYAASSLGVQKAIGFETNYLLVLYSRLINFFQGQKNTQIIFSNLFIADFKKADKIFVFLLPVFMTKLEPIVLAKCKTGTIIISNTFKFPTLKPYKVEGKTLVYKIP